MLLPAAPQLLLPFFLSLLSVQEEGDKHEIHRPWHPGNETNVINSSRQPPAGWQETKERNGRHAENIRMENKNKHEILHPRQASKETKWKHKKRIENDGNVSGRQKKNTGDNGDILFLKQTPTKGRNGRQTKNNETRNGQPPATRQTFDTQKKECVRHDEQKLGKHETSSFIPANPQTGDQWETKEKDRRLKSSGKPKRNTQGQREGAKIHHSRKAPLVTEREHQPETIQETPHPKRNPLSV